jgi:hypothetical protein
MTLLQRGTRTRASLKTLFETQRGMALPLTPNLKRLTACRPVRSSSSRRSRGRREVCNQQFSEAIREENRFVWEFYGNQ